jgi:hypothetical protein
VSNLTNAVAIAAGAANGYALLADGTVAGWGEADGTNPGETWQLLGSGTTTDSSVPVHIAGLSGVTQISAGAVLIALVDVP